MSFGLGLRGTFRPASHPPSQSRRWARSAFLAFPPAQKEALSTSLCVALATVTPPPSCPFLPASARSGHWPRCSRAPFLAGLAGFLGAGAGGSAQSAGHSISARHRAPGGWAVGSGDKLGCRRGSHIPSQLLPAARRGRGSQPSGLLCSGSQAACCGSGTCVTCMDHPVWGVSCACGLMWALRASDLLPDDVLTLLCSHGHTAACLWASWRRLCALVRDREEGRSAAVDSLALGTLGHCSAGGGQRCFQIPVPTDVLPRASAGWP